MDTRDGFLLKIIELENHWKPSCGFYHESDRWWMMMSRAVLLFIFEGCKTIQSIQNQHGMTSSSSGFVIKSTACWKHTTRCGRFRILLHTLSIIITDAPDTEEVFFTQRLNIGIVYILGRPLIRDVLSTKCWEVARPQIMGHAHTKNIINTGLPQLAIKIVAKYYKWGDAQECTERASYLSQGFLMFFRVSCEGLPGQ